MLASGVSDDGGGYRAAHASSAQRRDVRIGRRRLRPSPSRRPVRAGRSVRPRRALRPWPVVRCGSRTLPVDRQWWARSRRWRRTQSALLADFVAAGDTATGTRIVTTAEKEPTDSVPRPSYQQLLDGDSRAVPRALRQTYPFTGGPDEIPVRRYLDRGYHELEKSRLWSRVWQVACRDEQIPSVGDTWVYDIADKAYLIVRTGTGPDDIVAYPNACLHRGRTLRDGPGRVTELQCSFHGFCWHLDGGLKRIPSPWDFPHVDASAWGLRHLRVGRWGGFVF